MQPIVGFSVGSMGTRLYFAILSRISERDRTPFPSPKASHERERQLDKTGEEPATDYEVVRRMEP